MNRVLSAALICAAYFICLHGTATAMVEFCPAHLQYERAGNGTSQAQTASLYGFELTAMGPRTITASTLAFDTDKGWFTVDVPAVSLVEKDRHYENQWASFTHHDYISPTMYTRFPSDVTIAHAWVFTASAKSDGGFGWQSKSTVTCPPPPAPSAEQAANMQQRVHMLSEPPYNLKPADADALSAAPSANSLVLKASHSKPLERSDCDEPFREGEIQELGTVQSPGDGFNFSGGLSTVEVAIAPDGGMRDAWIWGPSGNAAMDEAALRTVRLSTYSGARAYCKPVPSAYFFRVQYASNQ